MLHHQPESVTEDLLISGCVELTEVRGYNEGIPSYVMSDLLNDSPEVPFYKMVKSDENMMSAYEPYSKIMTFKNYVKTSVYPVLEEWQKRKEYESEEQWRQRVNEKSMKDKIDSLIKEAKQDYIDRFSPVKLDWTLEGYDNEYGVFTVSSNSKFGNLYVKVPMSETDNIRKKWKYVKIEPTYGIVNDGIDILHCVFSLGKERYVSQQVYEMDDIDVDDFGFSAFDSYLTDNNKSQKSESKNGYNKKVVNDVVDLDIPTSAAENNKTFAVIIGNENYLRGVSQVDYAVNDANIFAQYCNKTLGLPEKNIRTYLNATYGDMLAAIRDIEDIANAYKGDIKILFYYAGHGMPDEASLEAYLLPVDADGSTTEGLYSLRRLYETLGNLKAKETIVFLDACFSGADRGDGLLIAARGVKLKPKEARPKGNVICFSASTGKQTAFPYKEKGHGMFTYYLLNKLRNSKGDVTLGDLFDYVLENVSQQSVVQNRKSQIPNLLTSPGMESKWQEIKLR